MKVEWLPVDRTQVRCCPGCGYLKSQIEIENMLIDPLCPRCGKHKLSEFKRTSIK